MERLEFTFEGTQKQYDFFIFSVEEKLPEADLRFDFIDEADKPEYGEAYNMNMIADASTCFRMGMIVTALYSKFDRLQGTIFEN